ncbi:MAG: histidinol-phosphatase [Clostridia bacterium]|nr:histidinol-phosphatase [Clostridia bacterium]
MKTHLRDLHTHTVYCDGKSTPEEMVVSAIDKGLEEIGVLCHSYVPFDKETSISPSEEERFISEVNALKVKYASKIKVLCGIEQDYYSSPQRKGYDYVIGSVHYFCFNESYYTIDQFPEYFTKIVNDFFGGDYLSAVEHYYELVSNVVEKTGANIIGHIDLITKFNENDKMFSTSHPRYINAYKKAVDKLISYGVPFEINTGVISRGYKSKPYPSKDIIDYIKKAGGKLVINSDAHHANGVAFEFDKWKNLL